MKVFVLIAAFLLPSVCVTQTDPADQIVLKAVAAMGGLERIHSIHTQVRCPPRPTLRTTEVNVQHGSSRSCAARSA